MSSLKPVAQAAVGDVILQPDSFNDLFDIAIWIRSPRFAHCGIYVGGGKMIAADLGRGRVCLEDAGATGSVAVTIDWIDNFGTTVSPWLRSQIGKKYDPWAWIRILLGLKSQCPGDRFTCSSLVGAALQHFAMAHCHRETTPDDIARILNV